MKSALWLCLWLAAFLPRSGSVFAADPWPAEPNTAAVRLTSIDPGLDAVNWSGAAWNPQTRTLWLACNSGYFWALVEDGAGSFRVATNSAGTPAKWTTTGNDFEAICQADGDTNLVYLMDENGWIREFDVSQPGVVNATRSWDIRAYCPEAGGASGGEGIAFIPDEWLQRQAFRQANGTTYTSTNGMGGLMFVGYQADGFVYAFDLNRNTGACTMVGRYKTSRSETAGLEFDRATGKLYIWHNTGSNYLEVTELNSTVDGPDRRLWPLAEYSGPRTGNLEGFALAPASSAAAAAGGCILTDDDNLNHEAVMWYRQFQPSDDTDADGLSDAWELWNYGTTTTGFGARRINSGGAALAGGWVADTGFSGGAAGATASSVANATLAPMALYQTDRNGPSFRYSLATVPNGTYQVRLHFCEMLARASGQRVFHVAAESVRVLNNLDVFAAAGGRLRALTRTFTVTISDGNGLQLDFTRVAGYAQVCGIEVESLGPPPPAIVASASTVVVPEGSTATFGVHLNTAPASYTIVTVTRASGDGDIGVSGGASLVFTSANYGTDQAVTLAAGEDGDTANSSATIQCTAPDYAAAAVTATEQDNDVPPYPGQINCGGGALSGGWAADTGFVGGGAGATASSVANATLAPMALYQTDRNGTSFRYSLATVPNGSYQVRLHFCEMLARASGQRVFHVAAEGARILSNLDVFAAAGGRLRALARTFTVTVSDGNGLQLDFTRVVGYAQICGIEITPMGAGSARSAARNVAGQASAAVLPPDLVLTSEDPQAPAAGRAVVDGDPETVWRASGSFGSWICLGYEQTVEVSQVVVRFTDNSPPGLRTLASENARDWFELEPELEQGPINLNYLWFLFPAAPFNPPPTVREIEVRGR